VSDAMFQKVGEADFVRGEHEMLRFWEDRNIFARLRAQNAGQPAWSFLDGPITANNPMGVHHAWGRTYKDTFQRYWAMNGRELRYQNGFDCQGLWVEVEVEKQLGLGAKSEIEKFGVDKFVWECKKRVLKYAAIQTEQSVRLGYWMEWDDPNTLRQLGDAIGTDKKLSITTPKGEVVQGTAEEIVARLGNPDWGGSYFTFSTENNETIWTFLKKCFERGKVYRGHDVMPWSGKGGSAYSQMEVADGRRLTTHRALFVRFPLIDRPNEHLLIWTTTPWTLTSNVAAMVNPEMKYVQIKTKRDGAIYYFAEENLDHQRLAKEFKEGFGRPEWGWPQGTPKLKTLGQIFKEQGGYETLGVLKGADMIGWRYQGPFDDLPAQQSSGGYPSNQAPARGTSTWTVDSLAEKQFSDQYSRAGDPEQQIRDDHERRHKELSDRHNSAHETDRMKAEDLDRAFMTELGEINWRAEAFLYDLLRRELADFKHKLRYLFLDNYLRRDQWDDVRSVDTLPDFTRFFAALGAFKTISSEDWMELTVAEEAEKDFQKNPNAIFSWLEERGCFERFPRLFWENHQVAPYESLANGFWPYIKDQFSKLLQRIDQELKQAPLKSAATSHRVIDGGRDSQGKANVVQGEGTGIVHSAPGCGDIDHAIGAKWDLQVIAPLKEDGTFGDGFGPFTGKVATAPETVDLVIEELKRKHLLVAVEQYPHIYPFCWRTGDELVFRLVDEWFINMDWRDEIMDVTRQIQWLPESIQGQEREVEWLSNMRDWMISKKRFWGLALPIWINPNDPSDFEVMGSLAELKERAVEGWNDFAGHTPHKPWIDGVKIKSEKTGAVLSRIPDVGNPWLDAGIVPFSTLGFNTHPDYWKRWYPADLVTECFPGQFRNWFYSMLSLSTMMQHGRTDDPAEKKPFKTLLGHRLVMNEAGKPMHKSDGTAIWFEEAAEQLGVDTMRWLYLQQNPATDLRFGTRHPEKKVTLQTVDGPRDTTIDGVPTCAVESGPADEVRRQVLLPLWNSYGFFINYARLDGFDPRVDAVPFAERPHLDQWILTNLQDTIDKVRSGLEAYDTPAACQALAKFIDDLSNWYIRRNRKRFWRSRDAGDRDKLAAYQTLYTVLVTATKLLAPLTPFLADRMYRNLVTTWDESAPESVHLCPFPVADAAWQSKELLAPMETAQKVVSAGHHLREAINQRVRQPLGELRVALANPQARQQVSELSLLIADELNVKTVTVVDSLGEIVKYRYRANPATLGKKYGKMLSKLKEHIPLLLGSVLNPFRDGLPQRVKIDGASFELLREDVSEDVDEAPGWKSAAEGDVQIALSTALTPELLREGMARDFVRQIQQMRKDAGLEIEQHIRITYATDFPEAHAAVTEWTDYIRGETLADGLIAGFATTDAKKVTIGEYAVNVEIIAS
jgi:isoleucyl-tRNA synthetase